MTKPADSGQIAKAREQRVKDFAVKHDLMKDGYLALYELDLKFGTIYGFTAAFAASERQAVIEDCCRAVCKWCSLGHAVKFYPNQKDTPWLGWSHPSVPNESGPACRAAAIRSME